MPQHNGKKVRTHRYHVIQTLLGNYFEISKSDSVRLRLPWICLVPSVSLVRRVVSSKSGHWLTDLSTKLLDLYGSGGKLDIVFSHFDV